MDDFGWSTQYAAEPCLRSCASDDDGLLSAFMCTSFHDGVHHHPDHGNPNIPTSQAIPSLVHCDDGSGLSDDGVLAPAAFMDLDTAVEMLRSVTGTVGDGVFLDAFACAPTNVVGDGPAAQATVSNSNTVFSGYGSTTAGGNISSGESNTCGGGGQDMEVASPCAAMLRPAPVQVQTPTLHRASSKRKLDKYPAASCAAATTAGGKRAAASASSSASITFGGKSHHHQAAPSGYEPDAEAMEQVKEMIYRAAAMRPVHQLLRHAEPSSQHQSNNNRSRRKNVRISSDPQTVAARLRRERVSERLRVLQRLVPGGSRMDTASMLDEAASYLRFLKWQLQTLESSAAGHGNPSSSNGGGGGHCGNGGLLHQNYCYTANDNLGVGGGGGGSGTVLAFGSRDGIGGYVKSNRTMPL